MTTARLVLRLSSLVSSAARAAREAEIRDDMIRVAHNAGASLRQLADVSGLGRKTVTAIVDRDVRI